MKQVPLNISNFEIGDTIVRIHPSLSIDGGPDRRDRSYIGKPMKFLGVANGCIYVEKIKEDDHVDSGVPDMFNLAEMLRMFTGEAGPISLPLDLWSEGWSTYIDPYNIGSAPSRRQSFDEELGGKSLKTLKTMYEKAIETEDYLKAERIKRVIDKNF